MHITNKAVDFLPSNRQDRAFRIHYDPEGSRGSHLHVEM
jgi:hypothetical protein